MKTTFVLKTKEGELLGSTVVSWENPTEATVESQDLVADLLDEETRSHPDPSGFGHGRRNLYWVQGVLSNYARRRGHVLTVSGDNVPKLESKHGLLY